jgi:UDP-4-amino-4,6-dideoxy-N-acetyl-beta-L-altrosamine N-acetyltransferase
MLETKRIRLRLIERKDLEEIIKWRATQEAYEVFFTYTPLNIDLQTRWYEKQLTDSSQENFIIEHKESNLPIGMIGLYDINFKTGHAEWGRVIIGAPQMLKHGYGREAIELVVKYAFDHLNLRRLACTALANNIAVVRLYERLGFRQEGILREYIYKDGRYIDVILFAMLHDEYKEIRKRVPD